MNELAHFNGLTRCYAFELQYRHCKKEYGQYAEYYPAYRLNQRYYKLGF